MARLSRKLAHMRGEKGKGKGVSRTTMNIALRNLSMMFTFAKDTLKIIPTSPMNGKMMKTPKQRPLALNTELFTRLYIALHFRWMKNFVVIAILTGLRRKELVSLTWGQINWTRKIITVSARTAKGQKEREVPLSPQAVWILKRIPRVSEYVFTTEKQGYEGLPVKLRHASGIITRAKKKAGIPGKITLHSLRHTYATWLIEHGANVPDVQQVMGHADIATTMNYNHLSETVAQRIVDHLPPLPLPSQPQKKAG